MLYKLKYCADSYKTKKLVCELGPDKFYLVTKELKDYKHNLSLYPINKRDIVKDLQINTQGINVVYDGVSMQINKSNNKGVKIIL